MPWYFNDKRSIKGDVERLYWIRKNKDGIHKTNNDRHRKG